MEGSILIKLEIILFFLSVFYIIYYWFDRYLTIVTYIRKLIKPKNSREFKAIKKINISEKTIKQAKTVETEKKLTQKEKDRIHEIVKKVKWYIIKWYIDDAKNMIVEWLAIDKVNKDLKLELAKIYEKEKKFKNAEYLYNEILESVKDSTQVLKKLWFVLALQKKYENAIKVYEKVHKRDKSDYDVIEMLSSIAFEIWDYKKSIKYTKMTLKDKPRNVEKLIICWESYEKIWENDNALIYFKRVFDLKPYDTYIIDKIKKLKS